MQGEREMAAGNKSLGRFDLADIPTAPRGVPQIEVNFDIDANGILNVSARDKATGKQQSIVIKASSGLSEDEIKKMVKDAEAHAEEDRKAKELVEARNRAENLVHASRKSLKELGDKVDAGEKNDIESAIKDVEEAIKGDDRSVIEDKTAKLSEVAGKLAERIYKQNAEQPQAAGDTDSAAGASAPGDGAGDGKENVVDAEFEEVDNNKK